MIRRRTNDAPIRRAERDQAMIDRRTGDLKIVRRAGGIVGWHAEPIAEVPVLPKPEKGGGPIADMLKQLGDDFSRWWVLLQRTPMPGQYMALKGAEYSSGTLAAKWLETMPDRNMDYGAGSFDKKTGLFKSEIRIKASCLTPAQVDFRDRMTFLVYRLADFDRMLVTARAKRVPWEKIAEIDVRRRSVRQLKRLHRDALHSLLGHWLRLTHKI
jgi:hypothetical protein